jgi:hypothetical protein
VAHFLPPPLGITPLLTTFLKSEEGGGGFSDILDFQLSMFLS